MHVLITGGTGFIGQALQTYLEKAGHEVRILSRKSGWDVLKQTMDPRVLEGIDAIVHLAGAGIADKRWTSARKKELIASRVDSTRLLARVLRTEKHQVHTLISASAIGYYGADSGQKTCSETTESGTDFLAECTRAWEDAVDELTGMRVVKLRIGLVMDRSGGIFPVLALPIRLFAGFILGSGNQGQSWIHREDLVRMFAQALTDERAHGVYNAVAPEPLTHAAMTREIASALHRPVWWPHVPAFMLRLVLGEMACLVTGGNFVSSQKIQDELGFTFTYKRFSEAIKQLVHV
jgi:uncharacterized protein (TIGR01777 family)